MYAKNWKEKTNAIGITAKSGHYGGTYTHKNITFSIARFHIFLLE
ncbi:KilA-N domain-containing protein [Treponema primitia]